jgi:hypothetical protein
MLTVALAARKCGRRHENCAGRPQVIQSFAAFASLAAACLATLMRLWGVDAARAVHAHRSGPPLPAPARPGIVDRSCGIDRLPWLRQAELVSPFFNAFRIAASVASLMVGRPRVLPWARARSRPALTRSRIIARRIRQTLPSSETSPSRPATVIKTGVDCRDDNHRRDMVGAHCVRSLARCEARPCVETWAEAADVVSRVLGLFPPPRRASAQGAAGQRREAAILRSHRNCCTLRHF